jgi:hypothetical protein
MGRLWQVAHVGEPDREECERPEQESGLATERVESAFAGGWADVFIAHVDFLEVGRMLRSGSCVILRTNRAGTGLIVN